MSMIKTTKLIVVALATALVGCDAAVETGGERQASGFPDVQSVDAAQDAPGDDAAEESSGGGDDVLDEGSSSGDYEGDYGSSGGCDPSFEDCTEPEPISDPYGSCSGVGGGVCPGGSCAAHDVPDFEWTSCSAECILGEDTCVPAESGTAVPVCHWDDPSYIPGDRGICLLSCADGETCPDGMECLDSWGGQFCAHPPSVE